MSTIFIYDKKNKELVAGYIGSSLDESDGFGFIWTEGNYSCDCNRGIFFDRLRDPPREEEDYPCGDTRYAIQLLNSRAELVYDEIGDLDEILKEEI